MSKMGCYSKHQVSASTPKTSSSGRKLPEWMKTAAIQDPKKKRKKCVENPVKRTVYCMTPAECLRHAQTILDQEAEKQKCKEEGEEERRREKNLCQGEYKGLKEVSLRTEELDVSKKDLFQEELNVSKEDLIQERSDEEIGSYNNDKTYNNATMNKKNNHNRSCLDELLDETLDELSCNYKQTQGHNISNPALKIQFDKHKTTFNCKETQKHTLNNHAPRIKFNKHKPKTDFDECETDDEVEIKPDKIVSECQILSERKTFEITDLLDENRCANVETYSKHSQKNIIGQHSNENPPISKEYSILDDLL